MERTAEDAIVLEPNRAAFLHFINHPSILLFICLWKGPGQEEINIDGGSVLHSASCEYSLISGG